MENSKQANLTPFYIALVSFLIVLVVPSSYVLTKVIFTGVAAYYAYVMSQSGQKGALFVLLIAAVILFNPIFPVYLGERIIWLVVDAASLVLFWVASKHSVGRA